MKHLLFAILISLSPFAIASDMVALPEPEPQAEIWCVEGWKFLYVENEENGTFQFFQITQNGGLAVQVVECDGSEVRTIP